MKTLAKYQMWFLTLAIFVLALGGQTWAQTFTTIHNFGGGGGGVPQTGLMISGNTLYGTTGSGGPSAQGTVFRLNTDGTGFATLHYFEATTGGGHFGNPPPTNVTGASPR